MKEAIGGTWIFTLVIVMIALFTSFICVSTNYNRSFKVKDEIIAAIQRNHGVNENSLKEINDYLSETGYRATGVCNNDVKWLGFQYVKGGVSQVTDPRYANFCIKRHTVTYKHKDGVQCVTSGAIGHPDEAYYTVTTFFRLDLPVIRFWFNLKVSGETAMVTLNDDISDFDAREGIQKC